MKINELVAKTRGMKIVPFINPETGAADESKVMLKSKSHEALVQVLELGGFSTESISQGHCNYMMALPAESLESLEISTKLPEAKSLTGGERIRRYEGYFRTLTGRGCFKVQLRAKNGVTLPSSEAVNGVFGNYRLVETDGDTIAENAAALIAGLGSELTAIDARITLSGSATAIYRWASDEKSNGDL